MFLKFVDYAQFEGTPRVWELQGCTLGDINLLVGRNATGKSRTLSVIAGLANLLSGRGKLQFISGRYKVAFNNNNEEIEFVVHYEQHKIIQEELKVLPNILLSRGENGVGKIYYQQRNELIEFQTPQDELASVARRDNLQHPFLEDLHTWAKSARYYQFGTTMGKDQLAVVGKEKARTEEQNLIPQNPNTVVGIFMEGKKNFSKRFTNAILADMGLMGYKLEDIGVATPESVVIHGLGEVVGLYVKEADLGGKTDQHDMSQGMFRALSLIIQVNYSLLAGTPSCILIDDIGEGLDYERSAILVDLLIQRAKNTSIQLIMATNDRFIMNKVPLEYWSVVDRQGPICRIYNYRNSPKMFEDFKLTGLNNFDFFSSAYHLKEYRRN